MTRTPLAYETIASASGGTQNANYAARSWSATSRAC